MAEYETVSFREPSVWPRVLAVLVALIGAPIVLWIIVSFVHTHVGPPAIPAPRMTLAAQTTSPAAPPLASPTVPAPTLADLAPTPTIAPPPPAEPRADPVAGKTAREAVAAPNPTPAEPEPAPQPAPTTTLAARAPDPAPAESKLMPDPSPAGSLRAPGEPFSGVPAMDIAPLLAVPGMPGPVEAEAVKPEEPRPTADQPKPETAETIEPGTPIAGPVPLPPVRPKRTAARPIPLPRARPDSIPAPSLTVPVRPSDDRFPVR